MKSNYADKILFSDNIYTGLKDKILNGGIAIYNNKILYVGSKEEVLKYKGIDTEIYDYKDKFITTGFHDDHVHLLMGCLYKEYPNLGEAASEEETVLILKEFYDKNSNLIKEHNWILGFNWYNYWWDDKSFPSKKSLDKYFKDVPVCLLNVDAHGVWVNSKALEICNIDKNTGDVPYGTIFRDENGEPTGFFQENACSLIVPTAYNFSEEKEKSILKKALKYCSKCGITSVNDMQPFFGKEIGNPEVFKELDMENNLPIRINFATDLFKDMEYTKSLREKYHSGKVYHNGLKQFIDGVIVTHTSIMLEDYTDDSKINKNFPLSDLHKVLEKVIEYEKEGFNIHLHATGDGAVRYALDCYEKAIKINGVTKSRMSIEHCDLINDNDFKRFNELGVIASVQPPHIASANSYSESLYLGTIGEVRERNLWAFKSLLNNNANIAVGTDYPVVDINPMKVIYSALTRLFPDNTPEGGFNPEQKLSISEVMKAYTYGGAYMAGREEELGTIECGKLADLVVLSNNLFNITPEEVLKTEVIATICDGKFVYEK